MKNAMFKRLGAMVMVLLHVFWSVQAFAAGATCNAASSLGSVFSVLDGGTIKFAGGSGDRCAVTFYGTSSVNVGNSGLTLPGVGGGVPCVAYQDQTTTTTLNASGTTKKGPTLVTYVESTSNINVDFYSNSINVGSETIYFSDFSTATNHTITKNGVTIQQVGNVYVLGAGDYGSISWQTLDPGRIDAIRFAGPIRAKSIQGGSCNNGTSFQPGLIFAPDDLTTSDSSKSENFINTLSLGSGCSLSVSGPNRTTINVLGKATLLPSSPAVGLSFSQAGDCINYSFDACKTVPKTWVQMDAQHPDLLQINLYYGNLKTSDRISLAAGLYVPQGNFDMTSATGTSIVGEILAQNVIEEQNNDNAQFFSKSTAAATLQTGVYSQTPPVADPVLLTDGTYGLKAGAYVYRALQRDYRSDNKTAGTSGHLGKFELKEDTTQEAVSGWDAADPALNTPSDRAAKIYTNSDSTADFLLLNSAPTTMFTDGKLTSSATCIINPNCNNGANLAGRDPESLVGVPWRTYPIIVGQSVLFATDDGILYSVSKDTGKLNWGWIPRQIIPLTAKPGDMALKHPWGQIASVNVTKLEGSVWVTHTYVTGTALGGQLHFSIEVSKEGNSLSKVVWQDFRSGKFSPGSETWGGFAGRPWGGAPPAEGLGGTGKVAYVVNNELVIRAIGDGNTIPTSYPVAWYTSDRNVSGSPDFTAVASNLIYMGDSAIYFGGSEGRVWQMNSLGHLKTGAVNVSLGVTEPVTFLNGARTVSTSGNGVTLVAQSASRVSILKDLNDAWSFGWYIGVGVSSTSISTITGAIPSIPATNNAYISGPTDVIYADGKTKVVLYYTTKDSTGCDIKGYTFGPEVLEDGAGSGASTLIGPGEAVGGYLTLWETSSGAIQSGVLAATGGTSSGNSISTGGNGSGSTSSSLTTNGQTKFSGGERTSTSTRLNWREMTNFF